MTKAERDFSEKFTAFMNGKVVKNLELEAGDIRINFEDGSQLFLEGDPSDDSEITFLEKDRVATRNPRENG
jgi:hypothetical protein